MKIAHLLFSGILMLLLLLFVGPIVTFSSETTDESDTQFVDSLPGRPVLWPRTVITPHLRSNGENIFRSIPMKYLVFACGG